MRRGSPNNPAQYRPSFKGASTDQNKEWSEKEKTEQLGGAVHAYNPDIKDCSRFEASLIYMPSGPARAL